MRRVTGVFLEPFLNHSNLSNIGNGLTIAACFGIAMYQSSNRMKKIPDAPWCWNMFTYIGAILFCGKCREIYSSTMVRIWGLLFSLMNIPSSSGITYVDSGLATL